ncbi:MAG: hypothetical protein GY910_22850 [bacterium]|nr:hypothetical protein [bacterium]
MRRDLHIAQSIAGRLGHQHHADEIIAGISSTAVDFCDEEGVEPLSGDLGCLHTCGIVDRAEADLDDGVGPVLEDVVSIGVDAQDFRDQDRRDRVGDMPDQAELTASDLADDPARDLPGSSSLDFDRSRCEGMADELAKPAMSRLVHQQRGGLFVPVSEDASSEAVFVALARIGPVVGVAQDGEDVVVASEDETTEFGVVVDRLPLSERDQGRVGILAKCGVEGRELHARREWFFGRGQ